VLGQKRDTQPATARHFTAVDVFLTVDDPEECRLAGAVRSYQADAGIIFDCPIKIAENGTRTEELGDGS
jgi:hypothetical protein